MANPVVSFGVSDLFGGVVVLAFCLGLVLLILLVALAASLGRKRYYARIHLESPRLKKVDERGAQSAFHWISRIVIILLIAAALGLLLFYLAKQGLALISSLPSTLPGKEAVPSNNSILIDEPAPGKENATVEIKPLQNSGEAPITENNQTQSASHLLDKVKNFVATYILYVIAGFFILIILISVLSSRKQD